MCSASTIYRSLAEAALQPGNWTVFPGGGGGVGIQGVQLARAMGLRVIAVDTGTAKRDLCLRMGAEHFVDFKETQDTVKEVVSLTDGIGAHGVFVTAPAAYRDAIGFTGTRVASKVLCIGLRRSIPPVYVEYHPSTHRSSLMRTYHSVGGDVYAGRAARRVHLQANEHHRHNGGLNARHGAGTAIRRKSEFFSSSHLSIDRTI